MGRALAALYGLGSIYQLILVPVHIKDPSTLSSTLEDGAPGGLLLQVFRGCRTLPVSSGLPPFIQISAQTGLLGLLLPHPLSLIRSTCLHFWSGLPAHTSVNSTKTETLFCVLLCY